MNKWTIVKYGRLLLFGALILSVVSISADPVDPNDKEALSGSYPKPILFRQDKVTKINKSYSAWRDSILPGVGSIKKVMGEELLDLNPDLPKWIARYQEERPESLFLVHLNGEARQTHLDEAVHRRFFPGHWVYLPGVEILETIELGQTSLLVSDTKPFSMKAYVNARRPDVLFPHDALLVRVDERGRRLWSTAEYVRLESIDHDQNRVSVARGRYFSTEKDFPKGNTVLLPIDAGVWGGQPMWFYNFSADCPRDSHGKTAAQRFSEEIAEWFDGPLSHLDGVAFDVVHWEARRPEWDVNNDGAADGGFVSGRHSWRDGGWEFLESVRHALGDTRIITADGHREFSQRALGLLNGIEFEGPVKHNDAFRGFSTTLNFVGYWQRFNERRPQFNYAVLKFRNDRDEEARERLTRFGYGLATVLGLAVGVQSVPDDRPAGWLGRVVSPLVRPILDAKDLLGVDAQQTSRSWFESWQVTNGDVRKIGDAAVQITGTADHPLVPIQVSFELGDLGDGDIVVSFEARSTRPLLGFPAGSTVPRLIRAEIQGVQDFGEGRLNQAMYTSAMALAGTEDFFPVKFYFRNRGSAKSLKLKMDIEEQGGMLLRNIEIRRGADVLARQYERGVVLVNPALSAQYVDLRNLFPAATPLLAEDGSELDHVVKIPAVDAVFLETAGANFDQR